MAAFHEGELEVQRREGVEYNADRIRRSIHGEIPAPARRFAEERDFVLFGAADGDAHVWATLLQAPPGFLTVPADTVLHVAAAPLEGDPLAATLSGPADVGTLLIDLATRRRMRLNGRARPDGAGGLEITAHEVYANCQKYIHPREGRFPTAAPVRTTRSERLSTEQVAWLSAADTLFIASRHVEAGADVSHRGGERGFVKASADRVLLPDYAGNMMFNTLGNVAADGRAGLLLVDFESGRRLQLTGTARILWDPAIVRTLPGAQRALELEVAAVVETNLAPRHEA